MEEFASIYTLSTISLPSSNNGYLYHAWFLSETISFYVGKAYFFSSQVYPIDTSYAKSVGYLMTSELEKTCVKDFSYIEDPLNSEAPITFFEIDLTSPKYKTTPEPT